MTHGGAPFSAAFKQSLSDAWSSGRGAFVPAAIFALCILLLTLNWPDSAGSVKAFTPAIFLVVALLIALMQTERIFQDDYEDGSLTLWACSELPLSSLALAKISSHWIIGFLPLALMAPPLAFVCGWRGGEAWVFFPVTAIFGLGIYFLGGTVGALTIAMRRNSAVIALLILPLALPLFVYASNYLLSHSPLILGMLIASCIFTICTTPFLIAGALRMALH